MARRFALIRRQTRTARPATIHGAYPERRARRQQIVGLPAGAISEGTTLALASKVTDADSTYFTYSWSISQNGNDVTFGSGPAFAATMPSPGSYTLTLTVADESGLSDTQTATLLVSNTAPVAQSNDVWRRP